MAEEYKIVLKKSANCEIKVSEYYENGIKTKPTIPLDEFRRKFENNSIELAEKLPISRLERISITLKVE